MLNPAEFVEAYGKIGAEKTRNSLGALFLGGVLAGFYIAMGALAASIGAHALDNLSLARLVSGMLFPCGLALVILTGGELFTGNCLIAISVLERKAAAAKMIRNLIIVYIGNFIGAFLLALAAAYGGVFTHGTLANYAVLTAVNKCSLPFGRAVLLGILCNILVCAGVMCSLCAKTVPGRILGAFVPVSLFVIGGFEHCVANMYYIPIGLFAGAEEVTWRAFLLGNLVPVTLGNLLGGMGFGGLIWLCHRTEDA